MNALAGAAAELGLPSSDELSAYRFHSDLFASGFERILVVRIFLSHTLCSNK